MPLPVGYQGTVRVRALDGLGMPGVAQEATFRRGWLGVGLNGPVNAILPLSTGGYLVGGLFNTYRPDPGAGLTRLATNGSYDASFVGLQSGFDGAVLDLVPEVDSSGMPTGKVLVAGEFTSFNGQAVSGRLCRLLANGALDPTFNQGGAGFNERVRAVVQERATNGQYTGNLWVGGVFTSFNGASVPRGLVRLTAEGLRDATFDPASGVDGFGEVWALLQQVDATDTPDGTLWVGGTFTSFAGASVSNRLIRMDGTGGLHAPTQMALGTGFGAIVVAHLATDRASDGTPTGKVMVMGNFSRLNGVVIPSDVTRLLADGTLDATFNPGGSGVGGPIGLHVVTTALQDVPTGEWVVGGFFTTYNSADAPDHLMRIRGDGTLDTVFMAGNTGTDVAVGSVIAERDEVGAATGNLLVGGAFAMVAGTPVAAGVARINGATGVVDSGYRGSAAGLFRATGWSVYKMVQVADGRLLVGGNFTAVDGTPVGPNLIRLQDNGDIAAEFNAGRTGVDCCQVHTLAEERNPVDDAPTGRFLVGGDISRYNGTDVSRHLVRIEGDGARDVSFNPGGTGFNGVVHQVVQERSATNLPTGRIFVRGLMNMYNATGVPNAMAMLGPNGLVDLTFDLNMSGLSGTGTGWQLALQERGLNGMPTGNWWVAGSHNGYNGDNSAADGLLRLTSAGGLDASFNPGGTGFNGNVRALAQERNATGAPTGALFAGGDFGIHNGGTVPPDLVRLTTSGVRDAAWNVPGGGSNRSVTALLQMENAGCLPVSGWYVGGTFTQYKGNDAAGMVALDGDGQVASGFATGVPGSLATVTVMVLERNAQGQPTGRLLVGGDFSSWQGARRSGLFRVDSSGQSDEVFLGQEH